jgi:hypothetical protein
MTKERLANIFHKFLNKKEIIVDGFVFEFNYVTWEGSWCVFGVNVVLPTKNWSYLESDMEQRTREIIEEKIYPIYGERFTVRIILTVNSEPALPCFINKPKLNQVITGVNAVFDEFKYKDFSMKLNFRFSSKRYQVIDDGGLEFLFYVDISDLSYKNKIVSYGEIYSDEVNSWAYAILNVESDLYMDVADFCWNELNDQLRLLSDTAIYSNMNVSSINGSPARHFSSQPPDDNEAIRIFTSRNA